MVLCCISRHTSSPPYLLSSHHFPRPSYSRFVAPTTLPTTLYRLEKKMIQSLRTPFSLSSRSCHRGRTSSGFVDDRASARDASLPANTRMVRGKLPLLKGEERRGETHHCRIRRVDKPCFQSRRRRDPAIMGRTMSETGTGTTKDHKRPPRTTKEGEGY